MPGGQRSIGIKRMGEVDIGPFRKRLEEKLVPEEEMKAAQLCSYWQRRVRNPSWHPFKIVISDDHSDQKVEEKHPSGMTSRNQIGSDDNVLLQFITEQKREKEESLEMLCEFEKQVQAKMQLDTKIHDLQVKLEREKNESADMLEEYGLGRKLQEARKETSHSGILLQGSQSLPSTGFEELKLKILLMIEVVAKQKLEKTIDELKGTFLVEQTSIQSLQEELQARNDDLEELNNILIIEEHKTNDELVEARKKLLQAFLDMPGGESSIAIKKMGEVDIGPFKKRVEEKLLPSQAEMNAAQLCSYWQRRVQDPSWHPFKIVIPDDHSDHKVQSSC